MACRRFPRCRRCSSGFGVRLSWRPVSVLQSGGEIFEMYWLNADPSERRVVEPWNEFATRSCMEVARGFTGLLQRASLQTEAEKLKRVEAHISETWHPRLVFCAYFVTEAEWRELGAR